MTDSRYQISPIPIQKGLAALFLILKQYLDKQIELERIVRVAVLLKKSGVNQNNSIFLEIAKRCLAEQKDDGGWIGVEDTVWCVAFLKGYEEYSREYKKGLEWLKLQRLENGGWGKIDRDIGRIPIMGTLLYLLPELSDTKGLSWLEREWKREFGSDPKLTYKAAFTLMAFRSCDRQFNDTRMFSDTTDWLACQQNDDFGWGPFRGQPVGSTPFNTGVVITGLLQYPEKIDPKVIADGIKWIEKNQLDEGLWPDHYIEEGSAWVFYALTEGYKFLRGRR
jgi:hypothetical protein